MATQELITSPSTLYVALFHGTEADVLARLEAGTLTDEVTLGSYARQTVTFGDPSGGTISNDSTVTFPTATAKLRWHSDLYCDYGRTYSGQCVVCRRSNSYKNCDHRRYLPGGDFQLTSKPNLT
jgi:hypothetical protein